MFARSETFNAAFYPYVGLGTRTRIEGTRANATAGYAGVPLPLTALVAPHAQLVGTALAGVAYRLPSGIELVSTVEAQTGQDDHHEKIVTGVRLRFLIGPTGLEINPVGPMREGLRPCHRAPDR